MSKKITLVLAIVLLLAVSAPLLVAATLPATPDAVVADCADCLTTDTKRPAFSAGAEDAPVSIQTKRPAFSAGAE